MSMKCKFVSLKKCVMSRSSSVTTFHFYSKLNNQCVSDGCHVCAPRSQSGEGGDTNMESLSIQSSINLDETLL